MFRPLPRRRQGFRCGFVLATFLLGAVTAPAADQPASPETLWKKLEPFVQPPEEFAGKLPEGRISPAEVQNFLITRKTDPEKALEDVAGWRDELLAGKERKGKA